MSFASCAGTENKTSIDAFSSLVRHRARQSSLTVPPRWGGGLGELRISSICTIILADSGDGVLLRQSDNAVVFFPITCDACSASPPLCKTRRYETSHSLRTPAYLAYRISLPMPAFRGLTSKPLRTAFSTGVAYGTPCCSRVNANTSALPPSVHKSVASAIRVLDTGFDGREGSCNVGLNLDRSGAARSFGGVHGRGGGLESLGGSKILIELSGRWAGRGMGGGKKTRVEPKAGAFSIGTSASCCAERGRRGSFGRFVTGRLSCANRSRSTTGEGRVLVFSFCLVDGPGCGRSELLARESVKSERKLGTCRA
jgi:hypothetical protein